MPLKLSEIQNQFTIDIFLINFTQLEKTETIFKFLFP